MSTTEPANRSFDVVAIHVFAGDRRAEADLRESEERYRLLVHATAQSVWRVSGDGKYVIEVVGTVIQPYQAGQTTTSEWLTRNVHPDDQGPTMAGWRRTLESAGQFDQLHRVRSPNGEYRHVHSRAVPLLDEQGNVREWIGTSTDVTDRVRAEEAVRRSEERYRTLFTWMDEGFCVIDVMFDVEGRAIDYRFEETNPAFEQLSGLHDVIGKRVLTLVPDFESSWLEIFGNVATTGEPIRFMKEAKALNNRCFDVYAFRLGGEESPRVAALFTDITARKRIEDEHARLAMMVESSRDAIIGVTPQGTITAWNRGAEELYGYTAEEILGQNASRLFPPELTGDQMRFLEHLERGESIPRFETVRVRKDGRRVEVELLISPIVDDAGQLIGIVSIARDVTDRKRLERLQQDFLAMAGHDLRTPLAVVNMWAQFIRAHRAYDERGVDLILEQTRRMGRLVDDLGDAIRLEAGQIELQREAVDLVTAAAEAVERAQSHTKDHKIGIDAPKNPIVGDWDRDRLAQVLDNLLGNAIKYSPDGGEVLVRVEVRDGEAHLSVIDQGVGIPAVALPRLFERFHRADEAGFTTGLGLGLYIVRMLVEAHGGRVWAESKPGEGSTFTVALPCET